MNELSPETDGILYYNRKKFLEKAAYNQVRKDTEKEVKTELIKSMNQKGIAMEDIADVFNISVQKVEDIIRKEKETH